MVKRHLKYEWRFRQRHLALLNRRNNILKEIENIGLIGYRAKRLTGNMILTDGIVKFVTFPSHPLSERGDRD